MQPLVTGTKIRLAFAGGNVTASAGCNTMSGGYQVAGDKLVVGQLATTEIGCPPNLQAQDTWLSDLLTAHPQFAVQGSNLILSSGTTVVTLLDREVAEPDQPLVGITWGLTTIIDGQTASSVPEGVSATILFTADGKVQFDSGCNSGGGQYTVDGDSLHFAQIVSTMMACQNPRGSVESAVRAGGEYLTQPPDDYPGTLTSQDVVLALALRWAEFNGLLDNIVGPEGTLASWDPDAPATRAEIAQLLWNLYTKAHPTT